MRCPFCKSPAQEILEQCPDCGFTLTEVQRVFGVAASLEPGLSDLDQIFSKGERRGLIKALSHFRRKFPQCQFSVIASEHPSPKLPYSVYAFWLFNTSGICRKIDKAGENHDFLLAIDSKRGLASLLVGYGLEPFVGPQHIEEILNSGKSQLHAGNWSGAVMAIVEAAESHLASICSGLNQTFGIDIQKIYEADKQRKGELVRPGEF
ncbi:MAG: TPM domain-containing protein [Verrucomicrobiales bacterium]|nr:TPM domain-containing protein [Verrucomicrobiae bacterium]